MTPREFIDFLHLAERLKDNTRHSTTSQGRPESVAEHSWRVALMAMLLSGEAEGVDLNKVLRMCVIHDLGEAITGDIPSFWKTEADTAREDKEVFALAESLPEPVRSEWKALFAEMIEMKTPEARVYKALDKMEAFFSTTKRLCPHGFLWNMNSIRLTVWKKPKHPFLFWKRYGIWQ